MIIQNGTIELKRKTAGGIDPETGFPVAPEVTSWSAPIPCQYSATKLNYLGQINGEHYTVAQYSVLIEEQPIEAEQVRLRNLSGEIVGEFSIIRIEPLEAVCEVKILI